MNLARNDGWEFYVFYWILYKLTYKCKGFKSLLASDNKIGSDIAGIYSLVGAADCRETGIGKLYIQNFVWI